MPENRYRLSPLGAGVVMAKRLLAQSDFKGSWRLRQFLSRYVPKGEVVCTTNYGFRIIVNPRMDPYQRTIFVEGAYEPALLNFMSRVLRPGDIFFDVGANIGLMTLAASRWVGPTGHVYAFEPEPSVFRRLIENVEINGADNVSAVKNAVGSTKGTREVFAFPSVNIGRASLVKAEGAEATGETTVITLDSFVEPNGIDAIRMMKIDVEGFEYEVLSGARAILSGPTPPILSVECDDEMPRDNMAAGMSSIHRMILDTNNYDPFRFVLSKFSRDGRIVPLVQLADVPRHDNIIYVPRHVRDDLPRDLIG